MYKVYIYMSLLIKCPVYWMVDIMYKCYVFVVIHNNGPGKLRQLNFARIVRAYVSKFALTDPREAVQYYYLLR